MNGCTGALRFVHRGLSTKGWWRPSTSARSTASRPAWPPGRAARTALDTWGRIDVLVNNAVHWGSRLPWAAPLFQELPAAEWQAPLRANTGGPYAAIQAVLPSMRARRWGRIVNVSSGVAVDGVPGTGPYGAARATMHGLTRTLAKELGPVGILVNVVMPGVTLTERMADALPRDSRAASQYVPDSSAPAARGGRADHRLPLLCGQHGGHR
jgi:NAD(P)-dependent dehydrogenase (short-subunit alcohol dehydrogenase family)